MNLPRSSGILLHVTSLPGGRLGPAAYAFVDWLEAAGQSWWQMLPLSPPDPTGSPYMSASAFAAWSALVAEPRAPVTREELEAFRARESYWLDDWERFGGGRGSAAAQVRFDREWSALRRYAAERGVRLIGDLPIYVAPGSADHRAHPELFQRGVVAGAPPDMLSAVGQLWGNPLYDWSAMRRQGYRWWIERLRRARELYDLVRIDHFRGFVSYWSVPEGAASAGEGRWRRGPGAELFRAAERELGELPLLAEDLGTITPAVRRLRKRLGLPGMVVLQFAYRRGPLSPHWPANHTEDVVVYPGTHDMNTAVGWFTSMSRRRQIRTGLDPAEPNWSVIDVAFRSRAGVAIIPAQDVLGLGGEAQTNRPATTSGNWRWHLEPGALTDRLATRLRAAAEASDRFPRS
jgi:4-alpha-glucanotransferase